MIQTIEINIRHGIIDKLNALIIYERNICYINNKKYKVTNEFMEEILDEICYWKNEYGSDDNIDSEEFTINIKTKENEEKYHGKGIFPYNYPYLKELLGEVE